MNDVENGMEGAYDVDGKKKKMGDGNGNDGSFYKIRCPEQTHGCLEAR